ncbi:MAG: prolyl oligopeptidase family serine peptidase [Candidatus Heimdallarchaeaceae archaeon]
MSSSFRFNLKEGEWFEFKLQPEIDEYPNCAMKMSFAEDFLHIKATVHDLHFKDGDRSWRYGDGFLFNFITKTLPENEPSDKFYAYGFSRIAGETVTTKVNQNGVFYLGGIEDSNLNINIDEANNVAYYDIKISWEMLYPFHPLLHKTLGINIRYNSQTDDGRTTKIELIPDDEFESEQEHKKQYLPIDFHQSDLSQKQFAFELLSNLVLDDRVTSETVIYTPEEKDSHLKIIVKDDKHNVVKEVFKSIHLEKGINEFLEDISLPDLTSSLKIDVFVDELEFFNYRFYRLNPQDMIDLAQRIENFEKVAEKPIERSSYYGLRSKLEELTYFIENFGSNEDPTQIRQSFELILELMSKCESKGHFYYDLDFVTTAFESPDDKTLQPYSIGFPENFNHKHEYNFIVALHGSGVDEIGFSKFITKNFQEMGFNYVVVAPRGRDLSDHYMGQTEKDVFAMIESIREMFHVNKMLIFGFSMGGYGVWRLTFLYPESFDRAIIGSGSPKNPWKDDPNMDVRPMRTNAKHIDYLVLHGTEDRAVPIESTKEFVELLQEEGFNVTFEVFEGAGHGNYDSSEVIVKWLKKQI